MEERILLSIGAIGLLFLGLIMGFCLGKIHEISQYQKRRLEDDKAQRMNRVFERLSELERKVSINYELMKLVTQLIEEGDSKKDSEPTEKKPGTVTQ